MNLLDLTPEQREEILKQMEAKDKPSDMAPYVDPIVDPVTFIGGGLTAYKAGKQLSGIVADKVKQSALKEIAEMAAEKAKERAANSGMMAREAGKASSALNPMLDAVDDVVTSPKFLPTRATISTTPKTSDMLENAEDERFSRLRSRMNK